MKINLKKYWDKFYFAFVAWFFRKTTLNRILYFLIATSIVEASTYAANESILEFLRELQTDFPNKTIYYPLRLIEVLFVQGSPIVLIISICFSILVWYLKKTELSKAQSGEQMKLIQKGLEEKLGIANQSLIETQSEAEKEEKQKTEYKKLLEKINFTLQEKNISKAEILSKFNKKLRIIVVQKNIEDTSHHYIKLQFYPHIGAVNIGGGVCVIPPNKIDQKLSDREILNWFEIELNKFIPDNYKFNFAIVSVVDLKNTITLNNNMHPMSKYRSTYLDAVDINEILSFRELESYLYTEKNVSSREIIEIPSLTFLTDKEVTSLTNYEKLAKQNNAIIDELMTQQDIQELKTTDIAQINPADLKSVLDNYMNDTENLANNIVENAKFWRDYFENKK